MKTLLSISLLVFTFTFSAQAEFLTKIGYCQLEELTGVEEFNADIFASSDSDHAMIYVKYRIADEKHNFMVSATIDYDSSDYPQVSSKDLKLDKIDLSDEDGTYTTAFVGNYPFAIECHASIAQK